MGRAVVAGVAMTKFGKFLDTGLRTLAEEAVAGALRDAGLAPGDVNSIFFANATSGVITRQECIRGQVALRHTGLAGVPVINVENACASGSTALSLAAASIEAGQAEVVLVVGAEKLTSRDKNASFLAFETALDQEELDSLREKFAGGGPRSIFMDIYALGARALMARTGATAADFAKVASKNHDAGALNPRAQYQDRVSEEEVLASRAIVDPLTLLMCSPLGDGAAAMVLVSPAKARALGLTRAVEVRAAVVVSGAGDSDIEPAAVRASRIAYARAAIGPEDVHVAEVHDATAPAELVLYEELGFCAPGGAVPLLRSGATSLGGRLVVNPSGGRLSMGHPVGATGVAQLVELTEQLRGVAGARQREGASVALAENGGGYVGRDVAACAVTVLAA
jgi:acetyl-CoA acetyltransferase